MSIQKEREEFEQEDFVKPIIHRYEWSEKFNKYKIKDAVINGNVFDLIEATDDIQLLNGAFFGWLAKSQAVPEGFLLVSSKELLDLTVAINVLDLATHTESKTNEVREMWQDIALKLMALGEAQEQSHESD